MAAHYLEFERPIADLEAKIEELSKLSETTGSGTLDAEIEALRARAEALRTALAGALAGIGLEVSDSTARTGGGTMPGAALPSVTLDLVPGPGGPGPDAIAARLREADPPVLGYAAPGRYRLDLRTVFAAQDPALARALAALG